LFRTAFEKAVHQAGIADVTLALLELIRLLETALGCHVRIDWHPAQPGDVPITFADLHKSRTLLGYTPQVDLATGLQRFAAWFLHHHDPEEHVS
jgi:UDP-glucuronate 4-epimerase